MWAIRNELAAAFPMSAGEQVQQAAIRHGRAPVANPSGARSSATSSRQNQQPTSGRAEAQPGRLSSLWSRLTRGLSGAEHVHCGTLIKLNWFDECRFKLMSEHERTAFLAERLLKLERQAKKKKRLARRRQ